MNQTPTALDFLAQELARVAAEKSLLQQALAEATEKIKQLEEQETKHE